MSVRGNVDDPFVECARQHASLTTQQGGDWGDMQGCYSRMEPGPCRVSGEDNDPGDCGVDRRQGSTGGHTK